MNKKRDMVTEQAFDTIKILLSTLTSFNRQQ